MRRFLGYIAIAVILFVLGGIASAAEFRLTNGDIIRGEPASFNDDGMVVRLEVGGFSPRIGWGKFTQESLKLLQENPQAARFVEPFIEIPPEIKEKQREKKREIFVKDPPRVENPEGKPRFFSSLASGAPGLMLLGLLYLANLYAAFEIAKFRNRPIPLVVGVSAILPVLGPLLFLAIPASHASGSDMVYDEAPSSAPEPTNPLAADSKMQSGLSVAAHAGAKAGSSNPAYNQVYNKSNSTFDRRFFEGKFSGFFRTIPADAEKDLTLVVKTPKAEYIAKRVSRISTTEMHLQLQRGGTEVSVPFSEITEVSVKHKDAK
ncbi:MAG: hypothetical protein ACO1QB_10705 [Verrucomicrobiales bacterium]